MRQDMSVCGQCPLFKRGYVPGVGYSGPDGVMMIGEAPGQDESFRSHKPFTGPAGAELDRFLRAIDVQRGGVYITNLVKCNPPDDRDPTAEEVGLCSHYLRLEMVEVQPKVIVTLGAAALRYFLPDADIERVWGIPQTIVYYPEDPAVTIFPLYHPALGLHQTRMLPMIEQGFTRLGQYLETGNVEWKADNTPTNYKPITHYDIGDSTLVAVDTEATWKGEPLYMQVSRAEGVARLVRVEDDNGVGWVWGITERPGVLTVVHHAMYDLEVLHQLGIHPHKVEDTMHMSYLLGDLPQGLKPLAYRSCGMDMQSYVEVIGDAGNKKAEEYLAKVICREWPDPEWVVEQDGGNVTVRKPQNIAKKALRALMDAVKGPVDLHKRWGDMDGKVVVEAEMGSMPQADLRDVREQDAIHYACRDADAALRVYPVLKKRIVDEGLQGVLDMDMAVIPMLLSMQRRGIMVDIGEMRKVNTHLTSRMVEEEREVTKLLGYKINLASPPQVAAMIEKEKIGIKSKHGKSGQQSVSKELLMPLRDQYPVIDHLLNWSTYETLRTTFTEVLPHQVDSDSRIYATIKTTRTATGRLAMAEPNLQNIPVRTEEGRMIRDSFVASPGFVLCSWDFEQIELRIMAHESQDQAMIQAFMAGYDIHTATAMEMFGISDASLVDSYKHRRPAKTVNFGIPYGITEMGLVDTMNREGAGEWTEAACKDLIDRWFKARPGVKAFMEGCKAHARRYGYIDDMWGRRRLVPEVYSSNKRIVEEGLRYAMNQPIQSGAQGVIKLAMGALWVNVVEWMVEQTIAYPLIQIHDDLIFEVREEEVEWVVPVIQYMMESVVKLRIPTPVEPKRGLRWGSMKKLGGGTE